MAFNLNFNAKPWAGGAVLLLAAPSFLKCKLNIPTTESAGGWAIVVTDKAGQSAQLPNALTLS